MERDYCYINEEKFRKQGNGMVIPSSVVSRIGTPLKNFIDIPNSKQFQLSFVDTESEVRTVKLEINEDGSSCGGGGGNEDLLGEIEVLRDKLRDINMRLEINQKKLVQESEESPQRRYLEHQGKTEIFKGDAFCSCSGNCNLF